MGRLLKRMGWILVGGVLCLVAAVLGLTLYTRTQSFARLLNDKALAAINGSIRGTVSWERIEGSIWTGLRIDNLQLRHRDRVIFKTVRAEVDYALLPLLVKRIQLTRLAAISPTIDLRKQDDGTWNIVEALSSGQPSDQRFDWTVAISGINLSGGEMRLQPVAGKPDLYWLRKLDVAGTVRIAEGLNIDLERLASWVDTPQAPQVHVNGGLNYRQTGQTQNLQLASFWVQSRLSRIRLSGAIKNFTDFTSDVDLNISRLAAQDLVRYVPQWPAGVDVSGQLSTRGPANALAGKFNLQLARGQISGTLRADLLSDLKPYSADVVIRGLSLGPIVSNQEIAGVVSATVRVAGAGAASDRLTATADARVQSLSVAARELGAVNLQAKLHGKAADIDGRIDGPIGQGNWRSKLNFTAAPQYRANLTLRAVDVARLWQSKDAPKGKLNFDATVNGAGFALATMNSQVLIEVLPSQWQTVNVDRGKIVAQIANGRAKIDELRLSAGSALLTAQGDLGLTATQSGRVNYQLQVADLRPWLSLVGRQGGGRLDLRGRAEGNLIRLQTNGSLQSRGLKLPEGSAGAARADFTLVRDAAAALPSGKIDVLVSDLRAGADLAELRAAITLPVAPQQTIGVRADARDTAGRQHRVVADIENPQGDFVVRARELVLTLNDGPWRMDGPATIARRGNDFILDRISLRNGRAQLAAEGRFALQGNQAMTVQASDIPLTALGAVLPRGADPTSVLSGQIQLGGTAALPELDAAVRLSSGQIAGQNYQGMQARADYRRQRVTLDMTIDQDSTHKFQVRGTVPLALAWAPSWRAQLLPGMELRAQSNGLSVAFLNTLKLPLENIVGRLALDMVVTGTPSAPQPRGTLHLLDGGFAVRDLGTRVNDVDIAVRADPSRVTVTQLSARAAGGTLDGSGVVTLKDLQAQNLDLRIAARRWPAIQTERYRAIVDGDVRVGGALTAPAITGKLRVIEGTARPDLSALDRNPVPLKRDPSIVVVQHRGGAPIETAPADKNNGAPKTDLWRALAIDLGVSVPNNLWVRHVNAEVELSGDLTLSKRPNAEPTLTGAIEAVRGWLGFQGRRFTISRGRVQFTGGQPIDPVIDVVAEYRANDYLVNAIAGGRASKPTLTLTSQPQLEQSDILALLLFGKTTKDLSGGEQISLQKNAIDITSSFAAAQIGRAVSNALGLESLGVDIRDGSQVRFGHYIGRQTYVSASQEISGEHNREFRVEYQLTPQIKIDATTTVSGNNGVDIIWHKRY